MAFGIGIYRRGKIFYSPRWNDMLGIEIDPEVPPNTSPQFWFSRVHREDRSRFELEIDTHLDGRTPHLETEIRIRHCDGNYCWMRCRSMAVFDEFKKPQRIAGSVTDITEGKVADTLT
ncbi:MAG: PAS domain-containing protein [Planctomycetota bacterium]